jgi:hypothetical protein
MTDRKYGRNTDGTFAAGNPGKPKGSRHKATQAAQALFDGEAEALTRQAVKMALNGDTAALRLCLERIVPLRREATVSFELPQMERAKDTAEAARAVLAAVASGEMTLSEGNRLMVMVEAYRRALELATIEENMIELEQAAK